MPGLDTSIPLQAKAPEMGNPLEMMLKVGQYKYLQQNSNRLQKDTDANEAVSQAIQASTGPDGKVDYGNVNSLLKGDPRGGFNGQAMQGANLAQTGQQISNGTAQIGQQGAQLKLNQEQIAHVVQQTSAALANPDLSYADVVKMAVDNGKSFGVPDNVIHQVVSNLPSDQAGLRRTLQAKLAALQPAGAQLGAMTPTPTQVDNGGVKRYVDTNPISNPSIVGTTIQNVLPPSQLQTVGQDPNGNPTVTTKSPTGAVVGVAGAPVQGQPTVAPRVIPATETPESYAGLQSSRQQANVAASKVKEQNFNNRAIIGILDNPKTLANPTGSNASWIADISSKIGLPTTGAFASDYNQINHYLAMQKQSNEKAMGVSSDAGRATAGDATGSTSMDPKSLRKATALNDATVTGLGEFNQGQEAAVAKGGIPAIRQFQNAWSKYYDVNALRILNATRAGDQSEIKDVVESLGGTKSAKFQAMRNNAQMLDQLKSGIIPNGGQ